MRWLTLGIVACTRSITAEPEASIVDGAPLEDATIDGTVQEAGPDGSTTTGAGFNVTQVPCSVDSGPSVFLEVAVPGKIVADLIGTTTCLHLKNTAYANGATIQCETLGVILKDGVVATYCPTGSVDYVLFAVPK